MRSSGALGVPSALVSAVPAAYALGRHFVFVPAIYGSLHLEVRGLWRAEFVLFWGGHSCNRCAKSCQNELHSRHSHTQKHKSQISDRQPAEPTHTNTNSVNCQLG